MQPPIIIDCDPGHDDVMAILLGGRALDLRGITTVHGNASLEQTTRNARQTIEFADLTHIPVAAALARPLVRQPRYAPEVHGKTGLDGPTLSPPTVPLHPQHAIDFLLEQSHAISDLHLVPIGPLTNIATALSRDPTLPTRIKQISLMGGSLTFGNATPAAEFNILCDPEAAHVVFTSGIPIKKIALNVTHQVLPTPDYRARIRTIGRTTTTHVADMLDFDSGGETAKTGLSGGAMHDPLAIAALVDPDILTFEPMHVAIELTGTHTAGMTLCDGRHLGPDFRTLKRRTRGEAPTAEVAVAVNADRFWELFLDILATYP
jgi:inosine-uridine nucleoside N-ribohydrolase